MQKDITSLQLRLVATVRRSRAAAAVVVNLCSLWMSSEAFTGDRWRLPPLPDAILHFLYKLGMKPPSENFHSFHYISNHCQTCQNYKNNSNKKELLKDCNILIFSYF